MYSTLAKKQVILQKERNKKLWKQIVAGFELPGVGPARPMYGSIHVSGDGKVSKCLFKECNAIYHGLCVRKNDVLE